MRVPGVRTPHINWGDQWCTQNCINFFIFFLQSLFFVGGAPFEARGWTEWSHRKKIPTLTNLWDQPPTKKKKCVFRESEPHTSIWVISGALRIASIFFLLFASFMFLLVWAAPLWKLEGEQSAHHRLRVVEEVAADVTVRGIILQHHVRPVLDLDRRRRPEWRHAEAREVRGAPPHVDKLLHARRRLLVVELPVPRQARARDRHPHVAARDLVQDRDGALTRAPKQHSWHGHEVEHLPHVHVAAVLSMVQYSILHSRVALWELR